MVTVLNSSPQETKKLFGVLTFVCSSFKQMFVEFTGIIKWRKTIELTVEFGLTEPKVCAAAELDFYTTCGQRVGKVLLEDPYTNKGSILFLYPDTCFPDNWQCQTNCFLVASVIIQPTKKPTCKVNNKYMHFNHKLIQ